MDPEEEKRKQKERAGELGRLAGRFVKNAGPRTRRLIDESRPWLGKAIDEARPAVEKAIQDARPKVEKAVEDYRPKVEQAGREAVRYAQDHQDEITSYAIRGARMRMGPLGMAIDALGIGAKPGGKPQTQACSACATANAAGAKFCSQCGARLGDGRTA